MKNISFPFLLLVAAQLIWAVSWFFTKRAVDTISPFLVYVFESIFFFVFTVPLIFYFLKDFKTIPLRISFWMILASFIGVLGGLIYFLGFKKVPFMAASLTALIFPFFATLLGVIFLHEPLTLKFIIAAIFVTIGSIILVL